MKKKKKRNHTKFKFEGKKYNTKHMKPSEILSIIHRVDAKENKKKKAKSIRILHEADKARTLAYREQCHAALNRLLSKQISNT